MSQKRLIGMIHLKALPTAPKNELSVEQIIDYALKDLESLQKAGVKEAIVENMFDIPYTTSPNLEVLAAYTHIFTVLKMNSNIKLGVNIHSTSSVEEMIIATMCGADFIRAETFVEARMTDTGLLNPMAADLMRKKKELNSNVKIYADVNVKHSYPIINQNIEDVINSAIDAGANAIILTGLSTGKAPTVEDAKKFKKIVGDIPLLIGSGVNVDNIEGLLAYADGAIVGSSIKKNGVVSNPVCEQRTRKLIEKVTSINYKN